MHVRSQGLLAMLLMQSTEASLRVQGGIDEEEHEVLYVGCLQIEIDSNEQEVRNSLAHPSSLVCESLYIVSSTNITPLLYPLQMVALELYSTFNCFPVFLGSSLKERYYKGTVKLLIDRDLRSVSQHTTCCNRPHSHRLIDLVLEALVCLCILMFVCILLFYCLFCHMHALQQY